jgi:hypothetical protein
MSTYASGTATTVDSSQREIGRTLTRYKVLTYSFGQSPGRALVSFVIDGYPVRVDVPLPPRRTGTRRANNGRQVSIEGEWEQEVREAWRALALYIKASLEAAERRLVPIESVFMAHLVGADGRTLGEGILPTYRAALASGELQAALPAGPAL